MDVFEEIPVRVLVGTFVQLTVILVITVWLDRRSGPRSIHIGRTLVGALVFLCIAAPFWWLLYRLAFSDGSRWHQSWVGCLLVFAPLVIAQAWGLYYYRKSGPRDYLGRAVPTKTVESTGTSTAR